MQTTTNVNGYNFPIYYQYTPGPGQYPGYGYSTLPPPPPPPQPAPTPPPVNGVVGSTPTSSHPEPSQTIPAKRGRGRPRGSGRNHTANSRSPRKRRKKANQAVQQEKENQPAPALTPVLPPAPPPAPIPALDVTDHTIDLAISDSEDAPSKRWPVTDRDKLFRFILGQDAEGDKRFEQHKKNPGHVYDVASKNLFKGKRTVDAIRGQWQRAVKLYGWMVAFDKFTGNGGGDPDTDDPSAVLKGKLAGARTAGLAIGSLTPATILEWEHNDWRDLLDQRFGDSAKVIRPVVRGSAAALSDVEDFDDMSDDGIDPALKEMVSKGPAATVSEPKHVAPASKFRAQAAQSFGNIGEYLKVKVVADEKKAKALEAKLELDEKRFELERQRAKVTLAKDVCEANGMSEEVKNAANSYLLAFFQD
ncbi:hypothetical protein DFH07DRAFT_807425 [Mycena maculata]|uniref:Uncharacterized protein n=1 Tax=Mycena maculata TaxID=230809 RepID=A0AAD7JNY2_9AGAR|nr:hypothetical protein DFH07DRAFT_807425 [Mycena maculata]